MRAASTWRARLASTTAAAALAASGLAGAAGLVASAGPAGAAATSLTASCIVNGIAVPIPATVNAAITPSSVVAGSPYTLSPLSLDSQVTNSNDTIGSLAPGTTLTISFTATLVVTGASPATTSATFTNQSTISIPAGWGTVANVGPKTIPITLVAASPVLTASAGVTQTSVAATGEGTISVGVSILPNPLPGSCAGGSPVTIASAPVIPPGPVVSAVSPSVGDVGGGDTIKVVGQNFVGVQSVTLDGNDCTNVQVLSPNVLTCDTPDGTDAVANGSGGGVAGTQGTVDVIVTNSASVASQTSPGDQFTYVDTSDSGGGAIVSAVVPNSGPAAGGNTVTIEGAGFLGANGGSTGTTSCTPDSCAVFFGATAPSSFTVVSDTEMTAPAPAGSGIVNVTVLGAASAPSPINAGDRYNYSPTSYMAGADGGVFAFGQTSGNANFFGSAGSLHLNKPVVGMAVTPDGGGYWLVAADGGVFAYGDATFFGSAGNLHLNKPVVGIAASPDGLGYWMVAADGGIFGYGDALFHGAASTLTLAKPIVGIAPTSTGDGYTLVGADGGIFAYGDAEFHGSASGNALGGPIVGLASTMGDMGYWLVGADGGVFAYGDASFYGSLAGQKLAGPISAITPSPTDGGYTLTSQTGAAFTKGDATFYGDLAGIRLNAPIVAAATSIAPALT